MSAFDQLERWLKASTKPDTNLARSTEQYPSGLGFRCALRENGEFVAYGIGATLERAVASALEAAEFIAHSPPPPGPVVLRAVKPGDKK